MHPEVQERLVTETRCVLGDPMPVGESLDDAFISYDQTQQLRFVENYLQAETY